MHDMIAGSYDYRLVALSVALAVCASYAALDLAARVTASRGLSRLTWLAGGAFAMGTGIWAMHYIGMLALRLPVAVFYNVPLVAASLLAAILASAVALFVVSRATMGRASVALGSIVMGGGIAGMHYIGMEAMRLPGMCHYSAGMVTLSVALAVLISLAALWLTFHFRENQGTGRRKLASAFIMGAAIPVMHYTGMAAVKFMPSDAPVDLTNTVAISSLGVAGLSFITFIILGMALLTVVVGRRFSAQSQKLQSTEERFRQLVEAAQVILWRRDAATSRFTYANRESQKLLGFAPEEWLDNPHFLQERVHPLELTVKTFGIKAHQKGLELTCQVQEDVPDRVAGDPSRLRQVITNLIGNAIKFTPGGEVALDISVESIQQEQVTLHFLVSDTGPGVPPEKLQCIFQPFVQADGSITRRFGGTGLGLTISSRLASLMNGRIWAESKPGVGSQFHFTAQFGRVEDPGGWAQPMDYAELRGTPVLIVDDNATNRRILAAATEKWGMKPALASSGKEALALLQEASRRGSPFTLVLSDVQMPEMDGFTLAAAIRENPALAKATILMLTSVGHNEHLARCRELGVAGHLTKPITRIELLRAVAGVCHAQPVAPDNGTGRLTSWAG